MDKTYKVKVTAELDCLVKAKNSDHVDEILHDVDFFDGTWRVKYVGEKLVEYKIVEDFNEVPSPRSP